jgi:hypothetical protein
MIMKTAIMGLALISSIIYCGQASAKPRNFNANTRVTNTEYVDNGATGASVGDISVVEADLLDPISGQTIGNATFRKIILKVDKVTNTSKCDNLVAYELPGGTIIATSVTEDSLQSHLMINAVDRIVVGGNRKYDGARGVVTNIPVPNKPGFYTHSFRFK